VYGEHEQSRFLRDRHERNQVSGNMTESKNRTVVEECRVSSVKIHFGEIRKQIRNLSRNHESGLKKGKTQGL